MRKKHIFIIISLSLIILNILNIANASSIIEESTNALNNLPINLDNNMINLSTKLVIVPAVICIITSIISLIIILKEKTNEKRNTLLFVYILNIILSNNSIASLASIIGIIMSANIKQTKKDKPNMPTLDRIDTDLKSTLMGILLLAIYFSQLFLNLININSITLALILDFITNIVITILCILIFKKNLKRDIPTLKNNFKGYISYILPRLGIIYLIYFVSAIISFLMTKGNISVNQEMINSLPLLYTIPLAVFIAPITEEIIFRGCIRRLIKNDTLFIIISGFVFGMLHMMHETSLTTALILCIPYSVLGAGFAYIYTKTNNITTNIMCHSAHNGIVMFLQILL